MLSNECNLFPHLEYGNSFFFHKAEFQSSSNPFLSTNEGTVIQRGYLYPNSIWIHQLYFPLTQGAERAPPRTALGDRVAMSSLGRPEPLRSREAEKLSSGGFHGDHWAQVHALMGLADQPVLREQRLLDIPEKPTCWRATQMTSEWVASLPTNTSFWALRVWPLASLFPIR